MRKLVSLRNPRDHGRGHGGGKAGRWRDFVGSHGLVKKWDDLRTSMVAGERRGAGTGSSLVGSVTVIVRGMRSPKVQRRMLAGQSFQAIAEHNRQRPTSIAKRLRLGQYISVGHDDARRTCGWRDMRIRMCSYSRPRPSSLPGGSPAQAGHRHLMLTVGREGGEED